MKSPYETLGVAKDATPNDVKKAFRKKAKSAHPDAGGSSEEFHEAEKAYAILANPVRRQRFDATGKTDDPETFRQKVVTELQALLVVAIQNTDWKHDDLIDVMKQALTGKLSQFRQRKQEAGKAADKWTDAIKRCVRKDGGENVIVTALENQKRQCEIEMAKVDEITEILNAVTIDLDLYRWRTDKRENLTSHQFFAKEFRTFLMQT